MKDKSQCGKDHLQSLRIQNSPNPQTFCRKFACFSDLQNKIIGVLSSCSLVGGCPIFTIIFCYKIGHKIKIIIDCSAAGTFSDHLNLDCVDCVWDLTMFLLIPSRGRRVDPIGVRFVVRQWWIHLSQWINLSY